MINEDLGVKLTVTTTLTGGSGFSMEVVSEPVDPALHPLYSDIHPNQPNPYDKTTITFSGQLSGG